MALAGGVATTAAPSSPCFDLSSSDPSFIEPDSSPSRPTRARYFFAIASQSATFSILVWLSVPKLVCEPRGETCFTDNVLFDSIKSFYRFFMDIFMWVTTSMILFGIIQNFTCAMHLRSIFKGVSQFFVGIDKFFKRFYF